MTDQTEHHAEATLAEVRAIMDEKPFAGGATLDLVRHWMMSDDHPVNDWERDFAAAIDAHRIEDARSNDTEHHAEAILRAAVPEGWLYGRAYRLTRDWDRADTPTETPLYPASVILDAVQAERAAIVAWLRTRWNDGPDFLADLIERGEHLPQDTPQ